MDDARVSTPLHRKKAYGDVARRRATQLIWKLSRRVGLDVRRWPSEGTIERDLQRVVALKGIDTALDVGANEGQYGTTLRTAGFKGRVISVEPNPSVYRRLSALASSDPRWITIECAVGAEASTAQLSVFTNHQLSSLHRTTSWAQVAWDFGSMQNIEVRVRPLDELMVSNSVEPASCLLKLDTQGHDMSIVRTSGLVGGIAALQLEMPVVNLYEDAPRFEEIANEVIELGFRPLGFYPVQREPTNGVLPVEFDGLFVQTSTRRLR